MDCLVAIESGADRYAWKRAPSGLLHQGIAIRTSAIFLPALPSP